MLSSRNVHVLLLGVILGAAGGYVAGSVEVAAGRLTRAGEALETLRGSEAAPHPEISDQDMLGMFEEALAESPDDPELLTRYATFLFDLRRFDDAVRAFERILANSPDDAEIRTYMATALYAAGDRERAMVEFQSALEDDPEEMLALHNLALGYLDLNGDAAAASEVLGRIQAIDPFYEGIPSIRQRIEAAGPVP